MATRRLIPRVRSFINAAAVKKATPTCVQHWRLVKGLPNRLLERLLLVAPFASTTNDCVPLVAAMSIPRCFVVARVKISYPRVLRSRQTAETTWSSVSIAMSGDPSNALPLSGLLGGGTDDPKEGSLRSGRAGPVSMNDAPFVADVPVDLRGIPTRPYGAVFGILVETVREHADVPIQLGLRI